ncbi:MAG: ABC transporter ATP-binding protein/permease [Ruminococcaceae bacterium]|nr:ABC transporter ATP-binding protein/permease [Oscillospiraceae bacterium]
MLSLRNIVKTYVSGDSQVTALRGVSIDFREHEFVSILGPSGCGKTTLLNVIGGLDRYSAGDLVIGGRSTKEFSDADWDTYRNHSIGFVFQSYNLIMHQTVLANVELALTLSGVSREERRARAIAALEQVGLGDQIHKKPNQMSGGQMQRVAIARALVNDPEIILADEPTGALDTHTSVQIMEILKSVAKEKLIIMVTHNPELAETYSSRIIKVLDGQVTEDTNPYTAPAKEAAQVKTAKAEAVEATVQKPAKKKKEKAAKGKRSMSFFTALSLSFNNLLTKKTRTLLVSVAGSIGIIGIALILALSNGVNLFIASVQEDTLSTYPLTILKETQDMSALLGAMTSTGNTTDYKDSGKIHVDDSLGTMMSAMSATVSNNLEAFKKYIEENPDKIDGLVNDIQYTYDYDLQIFNMVAVDKDGKALLEAREIGMDVVFDHMGSAFSGMSELMEMGGSMGGMNVFSEMIDNKDLLDQQYDVVAGSWPQSYNEVVLVVSGNNQISKMTLYMLGILDPTGIEEELKALMDGNYVAEDISYTFEELLNTKFMLLTTAQFFTETNRTYATANGDKPVWADLRENPAFDLSDFVSKNGEELKIAGIVRPKKGVAATSISGAVGYTKALTDHILTKNAASAVINQQKQYPTVNVLTGLPFERTHYTPENIHELVDKIDTATMDMFYTYMTEQILSNPEFSDRIQVTDTESFLGMFMLLPEEGRATIFSAILDAAKSNPANTDTLNTLCSLLSMSTGGIQITPQNFVKLLPVLDLETQILGALMGIPATPPMLPNPVPGLISMAGDTAMQAIYAALTESIKQMTVNREIFVTILSTMTPDDPAFIQLEETLYSMAPQIDATLESVLDALDDAEKAKPASINFYAKDFESKEKIEAFIAEYNQNAADADKLEYSDLVGTMMSSVTIIVDAISYVLIAFVSISLVVSSIMIGIITYISVLERTKEIGILRAIGASKRDISRVFNAETLIIGFAAGAIGILTTLLLCLPINLILRVVTDMESIRAVLPPVAGVILVAISMGLTLIAGLIPSRIASKKDPVVALRSE